MHTVHVFILLWTYIRFEVCQWYSYVLVRSVRQWEIKFRYFWTISSLKRNTTQIATPWELFSKTTVLVNQTFVKAYLKIAQIHVIPLVQKIVMTNLVYCTSVCLFGCLFLLPQKAFNLITRATRTVNIMMLKIIEIENGMSINITSDIGWSIQQVLGSRAYPTHSVVLSTIRAAVTINNGTPQPNTSSVGTRPYRQFRDSFFSLRALLKQ